MIIVAGTAHEEPVARVLAEADRRGIETLLLEESEAADWNLEIALTRTGRRCRAVQRGRVLDLERATGIYLRLTDRPRRDPDDPLRQHRRQAAVAMLCSWADVASCRVANRPSAMASNASKPYQAALIRAHGLDVPATVISNDPDAVRAFWAEHSRVIYKSTSGIRSIVHELTDAHAGRLDRVRHLPTQFQQLLLGTNVRVHVIGRRVFACEISTHTIDYRYRDRGPAASMRAVELPTELAETCRSLAEQLRLPLAGIDLLRDRDGRWWCFEVNPSPAYSCFPDGEGQTMAEALTLWLAGRAE